MSKSFETLIPDIHKLLDGHDLTHSVEKFSDKLGLMFVDRFKRYAEEREPKLYLSNVGKPLRQLWYFLKGFSGEKLSPEAKTKFLYGDLIEELFIFLAVEAGHEVTDLQKRLEFEGIPGKIDCKIDGVLVDVKSCSSRSFDKFKFGTLVTDDPFGYIAQLTGYKNALKVDRAAFVAIDKVSGAICTFELPETVYDLTGKIKQIDEALKSDAPPERCYEDKPEGKSGNRKLGTGCSFCAFKFECWKDVNEGQGLKTYFYSTGPRFLTNVAREPRVSVDEFEPFPVKEK